jgi:drug/metabolite transporter (DMT)-like permease
MWSVLIQSIVMILQVQRTQMTATRLSAFLLLALANLLWAGNWVTGRALRDAFDPVSLNFWRWIVAVLALAPFALREVADKRTLIARHVGILLLLALAGVAVFQSMVYLGLRTTTAINAVLLNSSAPLFMLLVSWVLERERASARQVAGILISLAGIVVILSRGDPDTLRQLEFHSGDAWILAAMPIWGAYSVLLKRRPPELGGVALAFVLGVLGLLLLAPLYALEVMRATPAWPTFPEALGVVYIGLAASAIAMVLWNRGVDVVGANAAGFTLHLLPAFGTVLAILFLGETFGAFHAVGIATILAGVMLATYSEKRLRAK